MKIRICLFITLGFFQLSTYSQHLSNSEILWPSPSEIKSLLKDYFGRDYFHGHDFTEDTYQSDFNHCRGTNYEPYVSYSLFEIEFPLQYFQSLSIKRNPKKRTYTINSKIDYFMAIPTNESCDSYYYKTLNFFELRSKVIIKRIEQIFFCNFQKPCPFYNS